MQRSRLALLNGGLQLHRLLQQQAAIRSLYGSSQAWAMLQAQAGAFPTALLRRGLGRSFCQHGPKPPSFATQPLLQQQLGEAVGSAKDKLLQLVQEHRHHLDEIATKWALLETKCMTIINSVSLSSGGHKVLSTCVPFAVVVTMFPSRFRCLAYELKELNPLKKRPALMEAAGAKGGSKSSLGTKASSAYEQLRSELFIALRGLYLALLFAPVLLAAPLAMAAGKLGREQWLGLVLWTLQRAGPAFIKWGQWAATRPDIFPRDLCERLETLQTSAPVHSAAHSRACIEAAFKRPLHHLFDAFEDTPVASGSIAQVHRARLSSIGASLSDFKAGTVLAIKVRHPGVSELMEQDFVLMERLVRLTSWLSALRGLRLEESLQQFGGPMREQLDLCQEAVHLTRFRHNFRFSPSVEFPSPIYPLVSPDVLVETFEEGKLISSYVRRPGHRLNRAISATGVRLYLQMLLKDNFVHADLHPGNVLVQEPALLHGAAGGGADPAAAASSAASRSWWLPAWLVPQQQPKVVLLDTGIVAELAQSDQAHLLAFFQALSTRDGARIGREMLELSEKRTCKDPRAFTAELKAYFEGLDPEYIRAYTQDVMREVIEKVRQHSVTLKSQVSTVLITALVLDGWASALDHDVRVLEHVKELVALEDWRGRLGRTVDHFMRAGALLTA